MAAPGRWARSSGRAAPLAESVAAGQWSQLREEVVADLIPFAVIAGDRTVPGRCHSASGVKHCSAVGSRRHPVPDRSGVQRRRQRHPWISRWQVVGDRPGVRRAVHSGTGAKLGAFASACAGAGSSWVGVNRRWWRAHCRRRGRWPLRWRSRASGSGWGSICWR